MQNLSTRLGRLAAATALTMAIGFAGFAVQAQAPAATTGTTNAATAGAKCRHDLAAAGKNLRYRGDRDPRALRHIAYSDASWGRPAKGFTAQR